MSLRDDVFAYVKKKYKAEPEYLWRSYPDYAVFRHADNRKWFGIVMNVPESVPGLQEAAPERFGSADSGGAGRYPERQGGRSDPAGPFAAAARLFPRLAHEPPELDIDTA